MSPTICKHGYKGYCDFCDATTKSPHYPGDSVTPRPDIEAIRARANAASFDWRVFAVHSYLDELSALCDYALSLEEQNAALLSRPALQAEGAILSALEDAMHHHLDSPLTGDFMSLTRAWRSILEDERNAE